MFPPFISSFLLSSLSYSCFLFSITVSSLLLSFLSSFCFLSSYVCPRYPYLFSSHSLFLLYSPWTISWFLFLCYSILFVLTFLSSLSVVCVCVYLWCTGKLTGTAFTIITHTLLQYPAPCISVALMQGIRLALIDSAQPCVGWFYIIVNMGWMPAPVCEKNPRARVLQPAPKSLLKSKHRHTERTLMRT